ncbi:hypothetical protein HYC85_024263 [Camellia sinensis]|uniref:Glycoside hydrolase family 3 N-terminal domain-containing protein n=1 Tax=Camellia sinensis TaxID=4442 RepID=A0A7J7G7Z6_CAMSI|nr:hypothetical protein HYC85_024263 [Camellia sinensis]
MSSSSRKAKNMNNNPIYKNPNSPIESRIKDLLSRMTFEATSHPTSQSIRDLSIGSILSAGGGGPFEKATSSDWIDMIDRFQNAALESRLGIPLLYGTDAVHGNNNVYGATIFPHNIGLGATRDAELVRRIGVATALEVRARGAQFTFAPCVAVSSPNKSQKIRRQTCLPTFYEIPSHSTMYVRNSLVLEFIPKCLFIIH